MVPHCLRLHRLQHVASSGLPHTGSHRGYKQVQNTFGDELADKIGEGFHPAKEQDIAVLEGLGWDEERRRRYWMDYIRVC